MKKKSLLLTAVATLGLTAATMAQNVPSYVPTNGLVGWWPFNGNANDESGNNNNGTVNGAISVSDRFGIPAASYNFDGLGDSIVFNLPSMANYSFNGWIKCSAMPSDYPQIYNFKTTLQNNRLLLLGAAYALADRGKIFIGDDNGASNNYQSTFTVNNGNWRMLTIVYDYTGGSLKLFVDNVLVTTKIITGSSNFGGKMKIGNGFSQFTSGNPAYDSKGFVGNIDDIGIWNRVLTASEIDNLYNGNICYQTITVTDTLLINIGITGFNPVTYNNTIKIFPNPTNDHITIDYGNFASLSGYQLKIENSLGQQVFQTNISQQSNYLSLTNWGGNGLYFVRIVDPQGNTIDIKKIVLQ